MADYLVRVELFDADAEEYELLYDGMESLGFLKTMSSIDGEKRDLPTGTYIGVSANSAIKVRDSVKIIADPLSSKESAIFVCAFTNWASFLYPAS